MKKLLKKIYNFFLGNKVITGLEKLPEDSRDFLFSVFGAGEDYKPKHTEFYIDTSYTKKQYPYNTCAWNSRTTGKEVDEGAELSVKYIVKFGKALGLIRGNGFTNLRSPEKVIQKYGICEESLCPDNQHNSWYAYSKNNLTAEQKENAAKHKSQSFWRIRTLNEALQAIESNKTIRFGISWCRGDNKLKEPFILNFKGKYVGGHAILAKGYNHSRQVLRFKNSFGEDWGDNSEGWIRYKDFEKYILKYGAFVDEDIPKDYAKWININCGNVVRDKNGDNLWFIENKRKRFIPDMLTFFSYGFKKEDIIEDTANFLPKVEKSPDDLCFWYGKKVKDFFEIAKMVQDNTLKERLKKYFSDIIK